MIEVETLLTPAPESPPCGANLEYDQGYLEFELLARGKAEQRIGDTVVAGEEPPWEDVLARGSELLRRSKDLRIASTVVRALVHTEGFAGLQPGLLLVHGLIDRFWEQIHPHLDLDDGGDPTTRANALAPLVGSQALLRELRDAPFARSRQHGAVLVRDIEIALGKLQPPPRDKAAVLSQAQIEAVLRAAAVEDPGRLAQVVSTLAAAKALSSLLDDKFGPERAPEIKPLLTTLHTLGQACSAYLPGPADSEAASVPEGATLENRDAPPPQHASFEIRSREDVVLMIDKIVRYLETHEPTNPVPLLLKRGKRFMSMSFADIYKEISPDTMAKMDAIVGPVQKEP